MQVKFNDPEEFITELIKDCDDVERRIVRVTNLHKASGVSPNITHIVFIATAVIKGQIIRLERFCGDIWNVNEDSDKAVLEKSKTIEARLAAACEKLNLELRAGVLEDGPEKP